MIIFIILFLQHLRSNQSKTFGSQNRHSKQTTQRIRYWSQPSRYLYIFFQSLIKKWKMHFFFWHFFLYFFRYSPSSKHTHFATLFKIRTTFSHYWHTYRGFHCACTSVRRQPLCSGHPAMFEWG